MTDDTYLRDEWVLLADGPDVTPIKPNAPNDTPSEVATKKFYMMPGCRSQFRAMAQFYSDDINVQVLKPWKVKND